jgi:hypothetical protein
VCVQKEGTLKLIRLVSPTVHSIKFSSKILGTFLMYLVCDEHEDYKIIYL